jgi:hypothetical protein
MEELTAALARAQALPASPITAELVLRAVEHGPAHPMTRAEAEAVEGTNIDVPPAPSLR